MQVKKNNVSDTPGVWWKEISSQYPSAFTQRAALSASPAPAAYKHADGKKIDGRRVLVDVERGRTVKGWHPRRLGGGLGGTRRGGADVNIKHSGRDDASRYDDRAIGGDRERDRGERRERSRERDRDKDRERRRSRSRERRRRTRSRERERGSAMAVGVPGEENSGGSRRRDRERERGAAGGPDSRSRERSRDRDRKRRSRSRERKRERERGKGLEGDESSMGLGDGTIGEGGDRMPEEHEVEEGAEGFEERTRDKDRERDRDRRRSHRDKDRDRDRERRRGDRDRDREHKRDRGDRERGGGDRRDERHGSMLSRDDMGPSSDMGNGDEGDAPPPMEEYSQDGMMMDQESVQSGEGYGSNENGYKLEMQGEEY